MAAKIKLTKTMMDKSIIDANKTVQSFLFEDFGMDYSDKFFTEEWYDTEKERTMRNREYIDGEEAKITFYRSAKRGDRRISIQKLKQYADAGNEVRLISDSEGDGDGTRIFISVYTSGEETSAN